uniref:glucan endo-1,3-beta-glucosidase-like n=1 Tax=Erigeron canadensis TaxID=72917 RepID=UPI001CB9832E|nr:glucan endo-1,3-beta-glucosidase-like [Erigeron canadensis]
MAAKFLLLSLLFLKLLIFSDAQSVGVCNGRVGNNLPSPQDVVNLYQRSGITRMRIYGPDPATLRALGGTNIELILDVPNNDLESLAGGGAKNWVQNNILNYPRVNFRYISVGNEVDPNNNENRRFTRFVLPAMRNVQQALQDARRTQIKVSTATYTGLLKTSYPPSQGVFHDNVIGYIQPIITFLAENNSPMLANIYPYFAYDGTNPKLKLSYALFTNPSIEFNDNGRDYSNLFDAMYDAHYAAQARLGGANVPIVVSESGWPSAGGTDGTTLEIAGTYYRNLIAHVKSAKGTPLRPGRSIETYLFAMFDENDKRGKESEKHFGVFYPNQRSKYNLRF